MLRARRWPAVRLCLLVVGVMLWGATVACATGTDRFRAAASQPHRETPKRPVAGKIGKKPSSARSIKCVAKARGGKQRKAIRSCVVKKSKTRGTKPAVSRKRLGPGVPSSYFAFRDTLPLDAESIYLEPDVSESVASTEPPSEPVSKPDEPITPVEPDPVNERVVPVERSAPSKPAPVTDPVAPVEEPAPVIEPVAPVEPPLVSEPVAPVGPVVPSEPVAPVEEPSPVTTVPTEPPPVIEPVAPVEPEPVSEPVAPIEPVVPSEPVEEPTPVTTVPSEPPPTIEPEPIAPVEPPPASEPVTPVEPPAPFRFFSATSVWNAPLSSSAPLDTTSAAVVAAFDKEIADEEAAKKGPAYINTTAWSVPVYTVPADQPTVPVTLETVSKSPALQSAWSAVPLPANAQPAAGTDEHLVVWQPSTDQLWEFWRLVHGAGGWQASWGGAIQHVSSAQGAYSPEAWPGAKSNWGASASSLSIAGGLITLEDLELGQINHALAMSIPEVRASAYALPAQRTDGESTQPQSLPEGAHLRLDPNLDLASLHLPRMTLMMAEAAQRYGIVVRDKASTVSFYAQDPTPTGSNPYSGRLGYFEGKSSGQLLASFPWSHLQLLKMELHSTS